MADICDVNYVKNYDLWLHVLYRFFRYTKKNITMQNQMLVLRH